MAVRRLARLGLVLSLSSLAALVLGLGWGSSASSQPQPTVSATPLVVVRAPNAAKWLALLRAAGAEATVGSLAQGLAAGRLVIPAATRLSPGELQRLKRRVRAGAHVVVADQATLRALGFSLKPHTSFASVDVQGLSGRVAWPAAYGVWPLKPSIELRAFTPLAWNGRAIVLAQAALGQGRILALAVDPFQYGLQGHEVFPTLGQLAVALTGADMGPERNGAEAYFDPGSSSLSPEQAAARFSGFRAVYVAGWNIGYDDPSFDYPYQRLVDALHARGIRAYAWLEPPEVNLPLWLHHPECREKTEDGHDAFVDWRQLIALEDPSCFSLAWSVWSELLTRFDWDGVNVAELYFESGSPSRFTPFHPSALKLFGHDPVQDPQGFLDWRTQEVTALNRALVGRIRQLAPSLDIELTVIDDELDPTLGRAVGSSVKALAAVARSAGATLEIEDPFTTWTQGPARYAKLVPKVTPLMPKHRAFFDINVVPRQYAHPTTQMTGVELALSVRAAASASGRVALYSASTLTDADVAAVPYAVAGAATTGSGWLQAPWPVVVSSPRPGYDRLVLDGRAWPAAAGRAIVPAGRHTLAWAKGDDGEPGLLELAGELVSESASPSSLSIDYTAQATAWAVVDRQPTALLVDGKATSLDVRTDPDGGFSVRLPAGEHQALLSF